MMMMMIEMYLFPGIYSTHVHAPIGVMIPEAV